MSKYRRFERKIIESERICEAFSKFLTEKQALNKAASTLRNYEQAYRYFLEFMEEAEEYFDLTDTAITAKSPVNDITKEHIIEWINYLQANVPSMNSVNHYIRDLRVFLYWCMDEGYITKPFSIQEVSAQEATLKMFTDEEIVALLEKPRKGDSFATWRMWAMINWTLATGNRQGTICDVEQRDIDFNTKQVYLRHTKSKRYQYTALSSQLEKAISAYLRQYDISSERYLFPSTNINDEKLTTNAMRKCFRNYCLDRGISRTNFHGLRHNFAKMWIKNKGSLAELQIMMGHSSSAMTMKYIRLFGSDIVQSAEKYNPLNNYAPNRERKSNLRKKRA